MNVCKATLGIALVGATVGALVAETPKPIPAEQFAKLHQMIKPQANESRFMAIPWLTSLWEGRQKAAAEGKPLLVWAGGWGVPIGTC